MASPEQSFEAKTTSFEYPKRNDTIGNRLSDLAYEMWRARVSYALLSIFFIPFLIFVVYPIFSSGYLSLTNYTGSPNAETEFGLRARKAWIIQNGDYGVKYAAVHQQ